MGRKIYLVSGLLVFFIASLVNEVYSVQTIEAPIEQTTNIILGYGRSVIVKAVNGLPPYAFEQPSCATLSIIDDDEAMYTATDSDASCTATFYDLDAFTGFIDFTIKCVCDYCTTETDGAMSANDDSIVFEELAYRDDGMGPDNRAGC